MREACIKRALCYCTRAGKIDFTVPLFGEYMKRWMPSWVDHAVAPTPYDAAFVGLRTEWVVYGRPAAEILRAEIAGAKNGDPLAPVTVIVPSNHVGVAARRLLASGRIGSVCGQGKGVAAVTFLTVYRLGELLGAPRLAAEGRRPVSTPVIGAAFRSALAERPGVFRPVATHPATEMALVSAYRELRDLTPGALEGLRTQSHRAADVVRLHGEVRRALEPSWYDEEDLLDAAAEALGEGHPVSSEFGRVVVYLPERISLHGAALLRNVAERGEVVVIAGSTGDPRADADTDLSVERLGGSRADAPLQVGSDARRRCVADQDRHRRPTRTRRCAPGSVRSSTPYVTALRSIGSRWSSPNRSPTHDSHTISSRPPDWR